MNEKRYYWLKLEENYFDLKVQKALRKLPSGSDMLICYLKMQLKYLNKGGLIEYQGIYQDLAQEIALDIDEEEDLVKMTLAMLQKWRVIEPSEDGLYITEMQERIGSKGDSALRVAKFREKQKMLQCNNNVTKCNSIQEIEKEKDIEIDIEKENNKESELSSCCSYIETNFGRMISPLEQETIKSWLDYYNEEIIKYAIKLAVLNNKKTFSYINGIIKNWKTNGYKTLEEIQQEKEQKEEPQWFGKNIPKQEMTDKEKKEMQDLIDNF